MLSQYTVIFCSVQSLSCVRLPAVPWTAARQASLSITNSRNLLKFMFIEAVMPSNHLILSCPLLRPPSIFPSIRVFSNELVLRIRWPKYRSFSFSISPSNEYSGLIFFRIDWLDLLAVQGTLKSSPTPRTFVGKVTSLLLICCLGGHSFSSKEQVSFNFMAAITICSDSGVPQNKLSHCFHCFPTYLP